MASFQPARATNRELHTTDSMRLASDMSQCQNGNSGVINAWGNVYEPCKERRAIKSTDPSVEVITDIEDVLTLQLISDILLPE